MIGAFNNTLLLGLGLFFLVVALALMLRVMILRSISGQRQAAFLDAETQRLFGVALLAGTLRVERHRPNLAVLVGHTAGGLPLLITLEVYSTLIGARSLRLNAQVLAPVEPSAVRLADAHTLARRYGGSARLGRGALEIHIPRAQHNVDDGGMLLEELATLAL